MDFTAGLGPGTFAAAVAVAALAGTVKGVTGFAMPMVMISGLGSFLPAETAVAALILPTFLSNAVQALRQGPRAAMVALRRYGRLIAIFGITILISAQALPLIPQRPLFLLLGLPILAYAVLELAGRRLRLPMDRPRRMEWVVGLIGGFFGGVSGVWGPLVVAWLLAEGVPKAENVRAQGVIYFVAGSALVLGHLQSGILNAGTWPLSAALILPALAGMAAGFAVQDRLDQRRFRYWTLVVLALAGANLIRRAVAG